MKFVPGCVFAGVCCVIAATLYATEQGTPESGPERKVVVRPLPFKPAAADFSIRFGGQSKLTTMVHADAVETLLGKDSARQLVELVDFTKEKIVLVSWTTAGPPEGMLKHELRGAGDGRRIVFYVQGPVGAKVRGQRARIAADFFAVPKDVAVSFDAKERF